MTAPTHDVELQAGIEAILFLADEPVPVPVLAEVLEVSEARVEGEVEALRERYAAEQRGIEVRRAAGGWRLYTSALARAAVERWAVVGRTGRLTQAALETLAVIAYKQPISRQDVGDIRGVNADAAIRSLVARGLVEEVGRHDGPGQAVLYGTSTTFLERLGLDSLEDLPPLTAYLPEAPAPDEPELGALREVRRRLARGGDLPSSTATGGDERPGDDEGDDEGELLPPPTPNLSRGDAAVGIDELTDELDRVARGAVDRLRQAREASADEDEHTEHERTEHDVAADAVHVGDPDDPADVGTAGADERG